MEKHITAEDIEYPRISTSLQVISNVQPHESLEFDPHQTRMIAFGIDKHRYHPKPRNLFSNVSKDVHLICGAFVDRGVLHKENVVSFVSSNDGEKCSFASMKRILCEQAKKTGRKGLFIVYYAGHGMKVANDRWTLVPMDLNPNDSSTFLTAEVLGEWIRESECKARVLCILDCCYSGAVAHDLMGACSGACAVSVSVIASCRMFDTDLALGPLQHTVFAYFFAYALRKMVAPPPDSNCKLPLASIFEECKACCQALSSLYWKYDSRFDSVMSGTMCPQYEHSAVDLSTEEMTDGSECDHELLWIQRFFKPRLFTKRKQPHMQCLKWLEVLSDPKTGPLRELAERQLLLKAEVLRSVVCTIMHSIASIQLQFDPSVVGNSDVFLNTFCHVARTISSVDASAATLHHSQIELDSKDLKESLVFYREVVSRNMGVSDELEYLHRQLQ